jgi:hypothetical protein
MREVEQLPERDEREIERERAGAPLPDGFGMSEEGEHGQSG